MTELLHDVRETKRAAGLVSVDLKGAYGRARSEKLLQFLHSKVSRRNGTILEPLNADQTSQGCFPKQSRFSFATCLRRLATRPPIILHALRLAPG